MKTQPKFVTKLFAAIDGYAEVKAQSEQQALNLSNLTREKVKPIIEQHNGVWIYEKDGEIFVNFKLPEDAVNAAVAIQRALQYKPELKLRIGIHTGDIKSGAGAGDIVASKIAEMTVPGGVCISDKVYAAVQNKVNVKGEFLEETNIEGVEQPIRVFELIGEGLAGADSAASGETKTQQTRTKPSIAVLPFVDMSPEKDQEWFCDGMTEEIINALSHVESLKVIARTSAFSFKGKQEDIREIGKKLDVENLLEGSVRKAGNRLRITAQLVKVVDGSHLWSEKYDRDMEDIFAIQDGISLAIMNALKVRLLMKEKAAVMKRHTADHEAYELYLKGNYFWNRRSETGYQKGIDFFQKAIEKDPLYALAFAGLSICYSVLGMYHYMDPKIALQKAMETVIKALEIDDTLAEAHTALGLIRMHYDWDFADAEREFKRALELNPDYVLAHHMYACCLAAMERHEESIAEAKKALTIEPLSLNINVMVGGMYAYARHYDEAIEQLLKTLEMERNFEYTLFALGMAYIGKMEYTKAIEVYKEMVALSGDSSFALGFLGGAYALAGKENEALQILGKLDELSKEKYVSPFFKAWIYLGLGEKAKAFEYLEKAFVLRVAELAFYKVTPILDIFRSDPRYKTLLLKMRLPEG